MSIKIGYARVSTHDQNLDLQVDALKNAGCDPRYIYTDEVTGTAANRPQLKKVMEHLREGDTLVVWRLDRLGRSLKNLIEWVEDLENRGVGFQSLTEDINTSTPTGKLVFQIFGALAEFERNLIRERTMAGLAAARSRGRLGGRRKALPPQKRQLVVDLYNEKKKTVGEICKLMDISKTTLYEYVKEAR
jgi:DNA invertase Pin-like site-specific DNA recombinase